MTTDSRSLARADEPAAIAESVVSLARDARRVLNPTGAARSGCRRDVLDELQNRAETLRGRIGPDRLRGARLWLEALQRQILAEQGPEEPSGPAGRFDVSAVRLAG